MSMTDSTASAFQSAGNDNAMPGIDPFLQILNAGVNTYQQIKLTDLNTKRLQSGLPALTADQVDAVTGNIPDAQSVGVQPSYNWLPWLLGGVVVFLLLKDD